MTPEEAATSLSVKSSTAPIRSLPDLFAPERSFHTFSLDEALAKCRTTFQYSRDTIAIAQLSLDEQLALGFDGGRFRLTEKAFDDLCKVVKVPTSFAKAIPTDLVATIIERLKRLHQQGIVVIHHGDLVVGIIDPMKWTHTRAAKDQRPHYLPVTNAQVLNVIQKVWSERDQTPRITVSDSGLQIEVLDEQLTIEPRVGDITRIGSVVMSSETGGPMPQARGYTHRLVCANGATVPTQFGLVRFETDWRVSFDLRIAAFEAGLRDFSIDLGLLREAYTRMVGEPASDHQFYNLFRQARYIYRHVHEGEALADRVLGVQSEQRRQIIGRVRQRQIQSRGLAAMIQRPEPTDLLAWDLFNNITSVARQESYQRRVALERLAGDVIHAFTPLSLN